MSKKIGIRQINKVSNAVSSGDWRQLRRCHAKAILLVLRQMRHQICQQSNVIKQKQMLIERMEEENDERQTAHSTDSTAGT